MNESTELIYNLLETLLLWATNQNEKIEINVMKHGIAPLIKSVSNNLRHIAKPKNINLNSDNIKDNCFTKFDKNSIEIVIRNITINTLKFINPNSKVSKYIIY